MKGLINVIETMLGNARSLFSLGICRLIFKRGALPIVSLNLQATLLSMNPPKEIRSTNEITSFLLFFLINKQINPPHTSTRVNSFIHCKKKLTNFCRRVDCLFAFEEINKQWNSKRKKMKKRVNANMKRVESRSWIKLT